jgi:hypothetical protein
MNGRYAALPLAALLAVGGLAGNARAQQLDPMSISGVRVGHAKAVVTVTAGPSGALNGFTVFWMKRSDFDANAQQWFSYGNAVQGEAYFYGQPTLNTWDGTLTTFALDRNQSATVEIGDLADEDGVTTNKPGELEYGVDYVFCAWANGNQQQTYNSDYSENIDQVTTQSQNCTFTQGFWKTHCGVPLGCVQPNAWPVSSLTLGTGPGVTYTEAQLLQILNQSVGGNGLISLAHQLIAAKLNIAQGADASAVAATILAADAQIGNLVVPPIGGGFLSPSSTSSKTQILDDYNNGIIGPGHCPETPARIATWGRIKSLYR